jgi:hypothetical protein
MTLPRKLMVLCFILFLTGCHPPPPTIGPQGVIAFQNIQIQKPLDLARDIAIEANATTPPLMREDVTRKIVLWHKSALTVLHTRNGDWKVTLAASMDEVLKNLNAQESSVLKPYFDLVKAILASLS